MFRENVRNSCGQKIQQENILLCASRSYNYLIGVLVQWLGRRTRRQEVASLTIMGKLFSVTRGCSAARKVTAGLTESDDSLPLG